MHPEDDTYMNILKHIFSSDQQYTTMSERKTEYIICLCPINNIQRFFPSVNMT